MEIFVQSASKQYSYVFDTHMYGHIYLCLCGRAHSVCEGFSQHYPEWWLGGALWTRCVYGQRERERERESVCISVMYSCLCLGWSHGESSLFKTASARSVRAVRDTETDAPVLSRPLFTHARARTHTCSRTQTATFL